MHKLSDVDKIRVCKDYSNGMSSEKLATVYNVSSVAIRGILNRRGIKRRTNAESHKKYGVNDTIFEDIDTPDKAYWIGFLMADGYITRNCIQLGLKHEDMPHAEKFRTFCESDHPLKTIVSNGYTSARLSIYSKTMVADLKKLGVVNKKTFITEYPEIDKSLNQHFIRGYFDGDGSISLSKNRNNINPTWSIIGTSKLLGKIREIMQTGCDLNEVKLNNTKSNNIYSLVYGGKKQCENIYKYLYYHSDTYLERKKNIFELIYTT